MLSLKWLISDNLAETAFAPQDGRFWPNKQTAPVFLFTLYRFPWFKHTNDMCNIMFKTVHSINHSKPTKIHSHNINTTDNSV